GRNDIQAPSFAGVGGPDRRRADEYPGDLEGVSRGIGPADQKGNAATRGDDGEYVIRAVDSDAGDGRPGGKAVVGGYGNVHGGDLVGEEGGDAERHGTQPGSDEDRYGGDPARVVGGAVFPDAVLLVVGDQRGGRATRASDAGLA